MKYEFRLGFSMRYYTIDRDPLLESIPLSSVKIYEGDSWYVLPETYSIEVPFDHNTILRGLIDKLRLDKVRIMAEASNTCTHIDREISELPYIKVEPSVTKGEVT